MNAITSTDDPAPSGHYSAASTHNGVVYVSGRLPHVPNWSADFALPTIEEQTRQSLANAEAALFVAGSHRELVLRSTRYDSAIAYWSAINALCTFYTPYTLYAALFGALKPARAIVPVGKFKNGLLIEIDMIAAVAEYEGSIRCGS